MNINVRWERVYSLIDEQSFMKVNDKMFQILASWLEHYWDFSHQPMVSFILLFQTQRYSRHCHNTPPAGW